MRQELKKLHVVLECTWELMHKLMHTIKELYENGASFTFIDITLYEMAAAQLELVTELDPVFLDEDLEACQGSIVGI